MSYLNYERRHYTKNMEREFQRDRKVRMKAWDSTELGRVEEDREVRCD